MVQHEGNGLDAMIDQISEEMVIPRRFEYLLDRPLRPVLANLLTYGFAVMERVLPLDLVAAANAELDKNFDATAHSQDIFGGYAIQRLSELGSARQGIEQLIFDPVLNDFPKAILGKWCHDPQLYSVYTLEMQPGAGQQIPHRIESMWPNDTQDMEFAISVLWTLTDLTNASGGQQFWPGSHARDNAKSSATILPYHCNSRAGDAIIILGSTTHASGPNYSRQVRRTIVTNYCLKWLRTFTDV